MAGPPAGRQDRRIATAPEGSPAMIRTLLLLAAAVALMVTTAPGGRLHGLVAGRGDTGAVAPSAAAAASRPAPAGA